MDVDPRTEQTRLSLRRAGARFAFVHGSTAAGTARDGSDLDVAAWWGVAVPAPWDVELADGVDLLILDGAPLELAGRVALHGQLLLDDDPAARVAWMAMTRKIYLDEQPRLRRAQQDFLEAHARG